ncbi:MAG: corrinoid protein [Anaerolineales bacterium]|nr:corrinoid protein [Anaerolineales bacterium]
MEQLLTGMQKCVIDGEIDQIQGYVNQALSDGMEPSVILNNGLIAAMNEVGQRFESGDFFVPEMLIAAQTMQTGLAILKPLLIKADIKTAGTIVLGTVKGDLHDIGKNLVAMMLEGAGFEIRDLGTDVNSEKFIEAVRNGDADILGMSALLTTTMPTMKETIDALVEAGLRNKVKIMIGGAPVTEKYAQSIGADGYAPDASRAVSLAKSLLN